MSSSSHSRKRKASASSFSSPSKKQKLAELSQLFCSSLHSESTKHETNRGLLHDPVPFNHIQFQTGQIVRIRLTDWVTFDETVIECEPGLNLIVGPNGTGKSSIVCAICLGLGGKPKSLGRGEKAADFIKYGRKTAQIQIELYNEGKRNNHIHRIISKNGTVWKLDGKKVRREKIDKFIKEKRNIKVDNLCQFLAQDRVSEFARLTPKDLLIETEKAIEDDQLYKWHKFLIDAGEKASNDANEIQNLKTTLAQNQAEIDTLHKTIEQFEAQKKMKKDMKSYEALREWKKVSDAMEELKKVSKQTKHLKKQYDKKKSDVGPLNAALNEWTQRGNNIRNKIRRTVTELRRADDRRRNASKDLDKLHKNIEGLEDKIQSLNQEAKDRAKRIKKMEHQLQALQAEADGYDQNEIEDAKQQRTEIMKGGLRTVRNKRQAVENKLKALQNKQRSEEQEKNRIEHKLSQWTNIQQRKDNHIFGPRHRKDKQLKMWVDTHRHEFEGEVLGPIVNEMTVTDDLLASFLNKRISPVTLYGYVCTSKRDWARVLRESKSLGLKITVYNMSGDDDLSQSQSQRHIHRPVDVETLNRYGIGGYLDQAYEAADIIKKCLNDNVRLNQQAYATQEVDARSLDHVLLTRKGQPGVLKSLITPTTMISCKASRYSNEVLRSINSWRPHRDPILIKTPDFSQQIAEHEDLRKQCHANLDNIHKESEELRKQRQQIVACIQKLNEKKLGYGKIIQSHANCIRKLKKKEKDLQAMQAENEKENPERVRQKLTAQIQKKNIERIMALEKFASETETEHNLMKKSAAFSIASKHFEEERQHIKGLIKEIQSKHQSLKQAYMRSAKYEQQLQNESKAQQRRANKDFPKRVYTPHWTDEDKEMNLAEIEDKINHLQGRINVLFIDRQRVERYERLKKKVEQQRTKLNQMQAAQEDKEEAIKEIEDQWKPKLEEAIDKISSKFGDFFRQFKNAEGKIELANHGNGEGDLKYSDYCIDIKTKFRNEGGFTRLTATTQSGGEKSVSTMLYLLSLQQVTTVPFRVVDEINQGMDAENERQVMQILNYECTPKARGNKLLPQYFVVTPKLLPRLQYSPCSSVYVIFNGPFQMPQQDWTLDHFVKSQKQMSPQRNSHQEMDQDEEDFDDESEIESDDDEEEYESD